MIARRRFLYAAGSLAATGVLGLRHVTAGSPLHRVERTSWALGTHISIVALHEDEAKAGDAIEAAFAEIERVETVMSIYRDDSEISRLNACGLLYSPHPFMLTVLAYSQKLAQDTGGAFDVTVQPLWTSFFEAKKRGALPSEDDIARARSQVDYRKVSLSVDAVRLEPGMQITLNGVAQGFALDRAIAVLRSAGIHDAMLDTGELDGLGRKPGGEAWRAGIQHPRKRDALCAVVRFDGRCLATSGDYETYFSDDFANNHIFNPHTGHSPSEFSSVSVLAESGLDADGLSTAVFVLGADEGLKLLNARGADAFFVRKDGTTMATTGFKRLLAPL